MTQRQRDETAQRDRSEQSRLEARVDYHVDRLVTQYERFERMADRLRPWAARWPVEDLARRLSDDEATLRQCERRLVALALKGSAESKAAIDAYVPVPGPDTHSLFYQVVQIEWERRNRGGEVEQSVA